MADITVRLVVRVAGGARPASALHAGGYLSAFAAKPPIAGVAVTVRSRAEPILLTGLAQALLTDTTRLELPLAPRAPQLVADAAEPQMDAIEASVPAADQALLQKQRGTVIAGGFLTQAAIVPNAFTSATARYALGAYDKLAADASARVSVKDAALYSAEFTLSTVAEAVHRVASEANCLMRARKHIELVSIWKQTA